MKDLAIIIPAYKEAYLNKTLSSLAQQTNLNFDVYIGDDCSPHNLKPIIDKYRTQLNISYTRFAKNTGAKNIVNQWSRCIDLVNNDTKWLWLFSDDDIAASNCVENFYDSIALKGERFDVYRFNTVTIDNNDAVIQRNPTGPEEESSEQMAYHLLKSKRGNSMPDHIFSREIYKKCGGFVFTDYAQGADWAMSILFSKNKGISIIPGAEVYWRYSGQNISSTATLQKAQMLYGHLQFIDWCLNHFKYLQSPINGISYNMMLEALAQNLSDVLLHHFKGVGFKNYPFIYGVLNGRLAMPRYLALKELLKIDSQYNSLAGGIYKLILKGENGFKRIDNLIHNQL
jgi:glycosyltransferase involved in cell wall biosynthesis